MDIEKVDEVANRIDVDEATMNTKPDDAGNTHNFDLGYYRRLHVSKPAKNTVVEEVDASKKKKVSRVKKPASTKNKVDVGDFRDYNIKKIKAHRVNHEYLVEWMDDFPDEWIKEEDLNEAALIEADELKNDIEKYGACVFTPKK
jgi:hypothetical protein